MPKLQKKRRRTIPIDKAAAAARIVQEQPQISLAELAKAVDVRDQETLAYSLDAAGFTPATEWMRDGTKLSSPGAPWIDRDHVRLPLSLVRVAAHGLEGLWDGSLDKGIDLEAYIQTLRLVERELKSLYQEGVPAEGGAE